MYNLTTFERVMLFINMLTISGVSFASGMCIACDLSLCESRPSILLLAMSLVGALVSMGLSLRRKKA